MPEIKTKFPQIGLWRSPLRMKLNYDPQTVIGASVEQLMQMPEPILPRTLYNLANGHADEFFHIEIVPYRHEASVTFTMLFRQLIRTQREAVLANLLDAMELFKGMPLDEPTLQQLKTSCSARLYALMQMESSPGDFGQDASAE